MPPLRGALPVVSTTWSSGSTRAWRATRAAVLARDGYQCKAHPRWCAAAAAGPHTCGTTAPLRGGHVHHTLGRKITGDDPRYLVAACSACNLAIGEPDPDTDPEPRPRTRW